MTVQRSSKGAVAFASADQSGGHIVLENTTSGARAKVQCLKNWRLIKMVNARTVVDMLLKDFDLQPGGKFTVYAKGVKDRATAENEQICDLFSLGVGTCNWTLSDDQGNEKATLTAKFLQ